MNGPKPGPFVNTLLLLRAIRWYNIGLLGLSQYLLAWFVFHSQQSLFHFLSDIKLHLIVLSTTCAVAGAFIINGFYDVDKDLVNNPKSVVFGRLLGHEFLLNVYFTLNVASVGFALLASYKVFIFSGLLTFAFWFYSHKLQKIPVVRELSASLLSIAPLVAVWLHYPVMHNGLVLYLCSLWVVGFTREIVKDLEGNMGNIIFGYETVVVAAGKRFSRQWLFAICLLSASSFVLATMQFYPRFDYFTVISGFSLCTALIVSLACLLTKNEAFYGVADSMLKVAIVIHIASLATSTMMG